MIRSVTVTNHLGESLVMDIKRPELSGLNITAIDGVGPGNATIGITELASSDGGIFNMSRVTTRSIVFYISYWPVPTIEENRHKSYKFFPLKKQVTLDFETDLRKSRIVGYVESNEVTMFDERSSCTITIQCPDPYFYSTELTSTIFAGVAAQFEYPFSNEDLTTPLLNYGEIENAEEHDIYYFGDADAGLIMVMHFIGTATGLTLYNSGTRQSMSIDTDILATITGDVLQSGDDLIISTIRGNKYAILLRDGVTYNVLNAIERDSEWFQISYGDNIFVYTADTGASNVQFRIENTILYEGI